MTGWQESDGWAWRDEEDLARRLADRVEQHFPGQVTSLVVRVRKGRATLVGEVASEACRSFAVRTLHGFTGVLSVFDNVEVCGVLVPAQDEGSQAVGFGSSGGVVQAAHHGAVGEETIARHPAIEVAGEAAPGATLSITVDLREIADPATVGFLSVTAPTGWDELAFTVHLASPDIEVDEDEGVELLLRADGTTVPARFSGTVRADAVDSLKLAVTFVHGTRFCGSAYRDVAMVDGARPVRPEPVVAYNRAAGQPDLLVKIMAFGTSTLVWDWLPRSREGLKSGRLAARLDLGADPMSYARELFRSCSDMGRSDFRRRLRGVGEQIWLRAPTDFRATYTDMVRVQGSGFSIQFVTDDPWVPWELMRPEADDADDEPDHLLLMHPVASWPADSQAHMPDVLPAGTVVTFAPEYDGDDALPDAQRESERLVRDFGAKPMPGTKSAFLALLEQPPAETVSIIHYAGHGGQSDHSRGLWMEDGWLHLDEVRHSGVKLGKRDGSMVVLSACDVGASAMRLGLLDGWPSALAANRFGAIVAPLWELDDDAAPEIVINMVQLLVEEGRTLGEALREARVLVAEKSSSALAFLAHGDVTARIGQSRATA